jgi:hypothetical protein
MMKNEGMRLARKVADRLVKTMLAVFKGFLLPENPFVSVEWFSVPALFALASCQVQRACR